MREGDFGYKMAVSHEQQKAAGEGRALALARQQLAQRDPRELARRAGVAYDDRGEGQGLFVLPFIGQPLQVTFPDGRALARDAVTLLLLHYLLRADGYPLGDRWIAFRELEDGLLYDQAFRSRLEPALLHAFAHDLERFEQAARALGGSPLALGDKAFSLDVLPRIRMALIFYRGDEEFPPGVSVLFDSAASHYLPTEDLAILGGMLAGKLMAAAQH